MDFKDTPEEAKFRKTCRDWLEKNAKLKTGVEKNAAIKNVHAAVL